MKDVSPLEIMVPEHLMRSAMDKEKFIELKRSLEAVGMINPITVRRKGGGLELVAGYRRLEAVKGLRWKLVPIRLMKATDVEAERLKVAENVDREDVSPMDEGIYINGLIESMGLNQAQIADVIGKSEAYVSQRLSTMKWPDRLKIAVEIGVITFSGGRELMGVKDPYLRDMAIEHAAEHGATLTVIKSWVEQYNRQTASEDEKPLKGTELPALSQEMLEVVECGVCGEKTRPDVITNVLVDEICNHLIKDPQYKSMMRNAREAIVREMAGQQKVAKKGEGQSPSVEGNRNVN